MTIRPLISFSRARRALQGVVLVLTCATTWACEKQADTPKKATPTGDAAQVKAEHQAKQDGPQGPAKPGEDQVDAANPEKQSEIAALIRWVEPDSQGLLIRRKDRNLDPELLATVFGWPPRAVSMWRELNAAVDYFSTLEPRDARGTVVEGPAIELVDRDAPALVFKPALANGNYIVLPHTAGKDAAAQLKAAGFNPPMETVPGTLVVQNSAHLPRWRAVVLDERHFALLSVAEIGSGLAPLTAGRDFPNSEAKAQVLSVLEADPSLELLQRATGPMVHFDLDTDVLMIETSLRAWQRGLDYQARIVVEEEPGKAVSALRGRKLEDENHQLKALAARVAFETDQGMVASRLQLTRDDLRQLRRR